MSELKTANTKRSDRISRRDFMVAAATGAAAIAIPGCTADSSQSFPTSRVPPDDQMIWAYLLHLGYNMWEDRGPDHRLAEGEKPQYPPRTYLRCQRPVWNDLIDKMAKSGINMVVIDIGEGVKYQSHPELAVRNSWTIKQLKKELKRMREMGIEPIPKLNFSTGHDTWLGKYHRMVSTDTYYAVCRDLIAEVIDIFDTPRFFHLGMDEEQHENQTAHQLSVVRQHGLWWHDLYYLVNQVERNGSRAWIWSDYLWHYPEEFYKKMPKSVLQSNWYYGDKFDTDAKAERDLAYVKAYIELDKHGYDQIPTGSNHSSDQNFGLTVDYCSRHIDPSRLKGFLQAPWRPTITHYQQHHTNAINQLARAISNFKQATRR